MHRRDQILRRVADLALALEFVVISSFYYFVFFYYERGTDARIYHRAVVAWVNGSDPWAAEYLDVVFAAPPPTLLFLLPFAWVPEDAFVVGAILASLAAAVFVLQRLRLPPWWLFFPPLAESITTANPNVVVVALLLVGTPVADAMAGAGKVYALVPPLVLARWRSLALFAAVMFVTLPVLPWPLFIERWPHVSTLLHQQAGGGKSALVFWPLVPVTVVALVYIGSRRSAWLAVPALWPATQFQQSMIALPALRHPILAATFAVPVTLAAPVGVCIYAAWMYRKRRRSRK